MAKKILQELKEHIPFTLFGAATGIILMFLCIKLPYKVSYRLFYIFHPFHIFLSALVTASMYKLHTCRNLGVSCLKGKCNFWKLTIIGYLGSVGIGTLSDSLIPYLAEFLLNMPEKEIHLGFIEEWFIVNSLAILGIVFAYFKPNTKVPHSLHVLVSTWASLFHILMAKIHNINFVFALTIFIFLFLAVWIPCCFSDIVFPLLFTKKSDA